MIDGFNEWYIDVSIETSTEKLQNRLKGIKACYDALNKQNVCDLVRMYYGLAVSNEFKATFAKYFSEIDPNFSERFEHELHLLAGATLVYVCENDGTLDSLVELLVLVNSKYREPTSTDSIQKRIIEQFYKDSLNLRNATNASEEIDTKALMSTIDSIGKEGFSDSNAQSFAPAFSQFLDATQKKLGEFEKKTRVFREDSQILWWMTSHRSNTLDKPLKEVEKSAACIVIGQEAASFIDVFPGPTAMKSVLKNMIILCKGKEQLLRIQSVVEKTNDTILSSLQDVDTVFDSLVPIHNAFAYQANTSTEEQWYPKFVAEVMCGNDFPEMSSSDFSWQMYLECVAMRCYSSIDN